MQDCCSCDGKCFYQVIDVMNCYVIDSFLSQEMAKQALSWYIAQDAQDGIQGNVVPERKYQIVKVYGDIASEKIVENDSECSWLP